MNINEIQKKIQKKILNNEELNDDEVYYIIYEDVFEIMEVEYIEEHRWAVLKRVIFKVEDKYYSIYYYKAATEYQKNEYPIQEAIEVIPKEVIRIEWVEKR